MRGLAGRFSGHGVNRAVAHLFCLFLAWPIFNPAFGGDSRYTATTLYLYCLLPLLDARFFRYLHGRAEGLAIAVVMMGLAATAAVDVRVAVRMVALGTCISYLFLLRKEGDLDLLGRYTLASCAVALVQFALAMAGSAQAEYLYPDRLAAALWGDWAILARPRFDDGLLFPIRVAGLAREPSFFNLQVLASLLAHFFVARIFPRRWMVVVVAVAAALSFSKVTAITLIGGLAAVLLRRNLDRIPLVVTLALWVAGTVAAVNLLYALIGGPEAIARGPHGESLLHRTVGYFVLPRLDAVDLVFGIGRGAILDRAGQFPFLSFVFGADKSPDLVLAGSGIAQSLVEYGTVSTMIQLACAGFLGLGSAGLITYLLFGITLNPLVLTAHGVIAGFLAFSLSAGDMRPPPWSRRSSGD